MTRTIAAVMLALGLAFGTASAASATPTVERCTAWNRWCGYTATVPARTVERCTAWNRWCGYTATPRPTLADYLAGIRARHLARWW